MGCPNKRQVRAGRNVTYRRHRVVYLGHRVEADAESSHCEHEVTGSRVVRGEMDAATSAGGYISCERAIVFHHVTVALAGLNPTHASTPPCVLVPRSSTDPCLSRRALLDRPRT